MLSIMSATSFDADSHARIATLGQRVLAGGEITPGQARPDASLGIIQEQKVADRLKASGLECYNHNLESSRRFFPQVCTTHTYEERVQTLQHLKHAGIKICSGGILGMGETRDDRCE